MRGPRSLRISTIVIAVCFATALRAGSDYTTFKADPPRTGNSRAWIPTRNLHELWKVQIAGIGEENQGETLGSSQIVVADGVLYLRWIDRVYAFDAETGATVWPAPYTNAELVGGDLALTYADGVLFLPGGNGRLLAIDAKTRAEKWRYTTATGGKAWDALVIDNRVYFVGGKTLVALDKNTGQEKWTFSNGQLGILAHVALRGKTLVYATNSTMDDKTPQATTVVAVNADNGAKMWESSGHDIRMTLALTDKYVITSTREASRGLDIDTGQISWNTYGAKDIELNYGGGGAIVSEDDGLFIAFGDGVQTGKGGAYTFADNAELWYNTFVRDFMPKYGNRADPYACVPTIGHTALGNLFVGVDKYGTMLFNNVKTGNTVLEYRFYRSSEDGISKYGYPNFCSPALTDGHIYVALGDGNLYCLAGDIQTDETRAPATWQPQTLPDGTVSLFDICFSDPQNGVVVSKGAVVRTTDGGKSWNRIALSGSNDWYHGIAPRSNNALVSVGQFGKVQRSDNSGGSWQLINENLTKHGARAVFFVDQNLGWLCGHNGYILKSTNGGSTWTTITGSSVDTDPVYNRYLQDIFFADAQNGIAVGLQGLILLTTDGGSSWQQTDTDWAAREKNDDLFAVHMVDKNHGIVVGALGRIRHTDDGGKSWRDTTAPVSYTLYDVQYVNTQEIYIAGTYGTVLYSNDGGETWHVQKTATTDPLFRLNFIDRKNGWAVGSAGENGVVIRTQQAGQTTAIEASPVANPSGYALMPNYPNPFVAGSSGVQSAAGTMIHYSLPSATQVRLRLFNLLGQEIRTLQQNRETAGEHTVQWDGRDTAGQRVAPGAYFVHLETGQGILTQRITVVR